VGLWQESISIGGDKLDRCCAIWQPTTVIGERTAEEIKINVVQRTTNDSLISKKFMDVTWFPDCLTPLLFASEEMNCSY